MNRVPERLETLPNWALARVAAIRLYEKGLPASSVVRSLKRGGHSLAAIAYAAQTFSEMDAMLFGEAWGGHILDQHKARTTFLGFKSGAIAEAA